MGKKQFAAVVGLETFGGVKPTGVQIRLKATTGPYIPRFVDDEEAVYLLVACTRGDVAVTRLDSQPVVRIDLKAAEVLEMTDVDEAHELGRRLRGERDRAISEASGYDGTLENPPGQAVHTDADGTVLTPQEVAARQGVDAGPSLEEAQAWWDEQSYIAGAYEDVVPSEIAELVGRIPLNEVEYIEALESADGYESAPAVAKAVEARRAAHREAVEAPGWSPLEDGVSIAESRRRLGQISDLAVLGNLLDAETGGKGRKRVRAAIQARIEEVEAAQLAPAAAEEPAAAVDEDPFS